MCQHTPGPWHAALGLKLISDVYAVGVNGQRVFIAECATQRDALLIAAAPAMYADAKQLCELVRDFMNDNRLYDGQVIQAISNLETALSQAEGRDK